MLPEPVELLAPPEHPVSQEPMAPKVPQAQPALLELPQQSLAQQAHKVPPARKALKVSKASQAPLQP